MIEQKKMLICYGRNSGTELGWMMFANSCEIWEERASEWEEVICLTEGKNIFRHKFNGTIAECG